MWFKRSLRPRWQSWLTKSTLIVLEFRRMTNWLRLRVKINRSSCGTVSLWSWKRLWPGTRRVCGTFSSIRLSSWSCQLAAIMTSRSGIWPLISAWVLCRGTKHRWSKCVGSMRVSSLLLPLWTELLRCGTSQGKHVWIPLKCMRIKFGLWTSLSQCRRQRKDPLWWWSLEAVTPKSRCGRIQPLRRNSN